MPLSAPESPTIPPPSPALARRQELWLYVSVAIVAVELLVTVVALCYGIITAPPQTDDGFRLAFPWISWIAAMVVAPALIVVIVHMAAGGLVGNRERSAEEDAAWQAQLPERIQRLYTIMKGAPAIVLLLALILGGLTLATIDGALNALGHAASALLPYLPYFIGGFVLLAGAITGAMAWFRYKNNRLQAEYAFRREVFERSGVIIVDKGSVALPPAVGEPLALDAGTAAVTQALPAGGASGAASGTSSQGAVAPVDDGDIVNATFVEVADGAHKNNESNESSPAGKPL